MATQFTTPATVFLLTSETDTRKYRMLVSALSPFRQGYQYLRYLAHDQPVIFFSCLIGLTGPVLALTVPPIRRNYFGYVSPEPVPTTYPLPKRPRRPVQGYDDE